MRSRPNRSSRRWCWSTIRGCRCSRSPTPSGKSCARWVGCSGRTSMTFAGINYWAVLVAGAIGFAFGGVWYRLLAQPWKAAHGFSTEQIRAHHGFVITTLVVNNTFGMRSAKLIAIDGGHWLAVLLLMGAIIGAWGV